jgi:hypothetical protein
LGAGEVTYKVRVKAKNGDMVPVDACSEVDIAEPSAIENYCYIPMSDLWHIEYGLEQGDDVYADVQACENSPNHHYCSVFSELVGGSV